MRYLGIRFFSTLVAAGLAGASVPALSQDTLDFGLAPYISTRTLVAMFKPLSSHLERALHRPVMLVTAPRLEDYDNRLSERAYDLAIVSPHTARILQRDHSYHPLLRFTADLYGVLLVKADSSIHSLRELGDESIAFPQRTSVTSLLGKELLEKNGVGTANVHYPHSFQDSVLLGLVQGEYGAALVNSFVLGRATQEQRAQVRQLGQTRKISHLMLVARTDLSQQERDNVQSAVMEFIDRTPEGAKFLKETGLGGVRPPTESDLRSLDTLAAEQRRIWEELRIGARPPR